jgi:hypothetical protein
LNKITGLSQERRKEGPTFDAESSADSPYNNRQCHNNFISVPDRDASGIDEHLKYNYNCSKDIHAKDNQQRSSGRRNEKKALGN